MKEHFLGVLSCPLRPALEEENQFRSSVRRLDRGVYTVKSLRVTEMTAGYLTRNSQLLVSEDS